MPALRFGSQWFREECEIYSVNSVGCNKKYYCKLLACSWQLLFMFRINYIWIFSRVKNFYRQLARKKQVVFFLWELVWKTAFVHNAHLMIPPRRSWGNSSMSSANWMSYSDRRPYIISRLPSVISTFWIYKKDFHRLNSMKTV